MPYALRRFSCPDCHRPVERRRPAGDVVRCIPCGVAYSAEEQRQLAAHEGPHYERWQWAWVAGVRRALRKIDPVRGSRAA